MSKSSQNKRYYWLRLPTSYFSDVKRIKMGQQDNGDSIQNIYLRMMLLSIDKGGYIYYQGICDTLDEELALMFYKPVEIVKQALDFLKINKLIEISDSQDCFIPEALECTGSECPSAERMRRLRDKKSQSDKYVTSSDAEKRKEEKRKEEKSIEEERKEEENEIVPQSNVDKRDRIDYQQIADMFNDTCVSFPHVTILSDKRKKAIKARLNTYSLEDFKKTFEMAENSDFLKGKNERNWSATFDWLISDSNMAKTLEGNYQNKQPNVNKATGNSALSYLLNEIKEAEVYNE